MSFRHILIPAALILLAAVSCETEIKFTGEVKDPKAVVYCNAIGGQPLNVSISRSVFLTEYPEEYRSYADDLSGKIKSVKATFNGKEEELELTYDPKVTPPVSNRWDSCAFIYSSKTIAQAGETIGLQVQIDGFGTITSETVVPKTPQIEILGANKTNDNELEFTLCLHDDPDTENWYQLLFSYTDTSGHTFFKDYNSNDIIAVTSNGSDITSYFTDTNLFTDEMINGMSYTFKAGTYLYYNNTQNPGFTWTFTLRNISQSLYYYLSSRNTLDQMSGMGTIGEYATLYSNVTGGIGCLSAWSSTSDSIEF